MRIIFNMAELFESLVNTEGIQTSLLSTADHWQFESLVNTEGIQTSRLIRKK